MNVKEKLMMGIYDYRPLIKELNDEITRYFEEEIYHEYFYEEKGVIVLKKGKWDILPTFFKHYLINLYVEFRGKIDL